MLKDKKKPLPRITDDSSIAYRNPSDLSQCPYCHQLFKKGTEHKCGANWFVCTICGLDLQKKKEKWIITPSGRRYKISGFKKYFRIVNSMICWNCVFSLVKMFRAEADR